MKIIDGCPSDRHTPIHLSPIFDGGKMRRYLTRVFASLALVLATTAVIRFQQAYGLGADGIAGPQTFSRLYALQDDDCTPVNFSYAELNNCNSTWSGGNVSAATARSNALISMWKLQAMRHALGD